MSTTTDRTGYIRDCTDLLQFPVKGSTKLLRHTLAAVDSSGYLVAPDAIGAQFFAGLTDSQYDNTAGADGAMDGRVLNDIVDESLVKSGTITAANLGEPAMAIDNNTVGVARAAATIDCTNANSDLDFTAKRAWTGKRGEDITVEFRDPSANDQSLGVVVEGCAIIVSLATGAGGAITSTAAQVKAAIEANELANAMVTVAHNGASTGAGIVEAKVARLALDGLLCGFITFLPTGAAEVALQFAGGM